MSSLHPAITSISFLLEYTQQAFPSQGTTSFLATVIFPRDYPEKTTAALKALGRCLMQPPGEGGGAVLEGIHAEVCVHNYVPHCISLLIWTHASAQRNLLSIFLGPYRS